MMLTWRFAIIIITIIIIIIIIIMSWLRARLSKMVHS